MTATISLEGVRKSYGPVTALREISLQVGAGKFVVLLGPSGCGKTTLLSLIAGFTQPSGGRILFDGRDVTDWPAYERNLGVVFQDYALFPHLDIGDNVAFPLEVRRMARPEIARSVAQALETVHLQGFQARFPDELSGGQKQRVALARALVFRPSVLLFDEPLGALDRRLRDAMQSELKALHRDMGATFVYVTHDQDEAMAMADLVVVMRDGRIEQAGAPDEIYDRPRTRFVATFVGDCNIVAGRLRREGDSLVLRHAESGTLLHRAAAGGTAGGESAGEVALRPEWISLVEGPEQASAAPLSRVEGRIVQRRFLGREVLLHLETPLGPLLVQSPRGRGVDPDRLADLVQLTWNPESSVLLAS